MPEHNTYRPAVISLCSFYVFFLTCTQYIGPKQSYLKWDSTYRQRKHGIKKSRTQSTGYNNGQQLPGYCRDQIAEPHDHGICSSAEIPGYAAADSTAHDSHYGTGKPHGQGISAAVNQSAHTVPAQRIGPKWMLQCRKRINTCQIQIVRSIRSKNRCKHTDYYNGSKQNGSKHCRFIFT